MTDVSVKQLEKMMIQQFGFSHQDSICFVVKVSNLLVNDLFACQKKSLKKFLVNCKIKVTNTYKMLQQAYGE
jgi:hypothetical protein